MKVLIGTLLGSFIVLMIFGVWTYLDYEKQSSLEEKPYTIAEVNVENEPKKKGSLTKIQNIKKDTKLYQWKDENGQLVIGTNPPAHINAVIHKPESGMTVINFSEVQEKKLTPTQKKTAKPLRVASDTNSKQSIISRNHTHCRWLVGRAKDAYEKILKNQTSRPSIWCDEHKKWLKEMRKLSAEGDGCDYPHRTPSSCY